METNATLHDQTVVQEIASLDDLALRALSLAERQGNVSAITTEQLRLSSGARIRDIQRALMLLQELQFISPTNTRAENPAYEVTAAGKMYLRACDS